MKKFIMVFVCLMTMVISANAQSYDPIIQKAYENWVKSSIYDNKSSYSRVKMVFFPLMRNEKYKTIEDFIRIKWTNEHKINGWGSKAKVGSYANKIYEEFNKYLHNPKVYEHDRLVYPEAYHSDMYGHFDNGNCTHENGCICRNQPSSNLLRTYASQYEAAKKEYLGFSDGGGDVVLLSEYYYYPSYCHGEYKGYRCLICMEERIALSADLYDKLLRKRFKNWKNSDDYKTKSLNRQHALKVEKENKIKRENEEKNNFDIIIKRIR